MHNPPAKFLLWGRKDSPAGVQLSFFHSEAPHIIWTMHLPSCPVFRMPLSSRIQEDVEDKVDEEMPEPPTTELSDNNSDNSYISNSNAGGTCRPSPEQGSFRQSSLLPVFTREQLAESASNDEATNTTSTRSSRHAARLINEPKSICGIPYTLFSILLALGVAVMIGTILAVIYYNPNDTGGIPTLDEPTSPSSTMAPTTNRRL
jgi:hypothetical protein